MTDNARIRFEKLITEIEDRLNPDWIDHPDYRTGPTNLNGPNPNPLEIYIGGATPASWTEDNFNNHFAEAKTIAEKYDITVDKCADPNHGFWYVFALHANPHVAPNKLSHRMITEPEDPEKSEHH